MPKSVGVALWRIKELRKRLGGGSDSPRIHQITPLFSIVYEERFRTVRELYGSRSDPLSELALCRPPSAPGAPAPVAHRAFL
jgi:hypothetical protein